MVRTKTGGSTYIYGTLEDSGLRDSVKVTVVEGDPFMEVGGEIVLEAEHFHSVDQRRETISWISGNEIPGSAGIYIYVPDGMGSATDSPEYLTKTYVSYVLHFDRPGEYRFYVRRFAEDGGNNSAFYYFDDIRLSAIDNSGDFNQWIWKSMGQISISNPGVYLLEVVRREDGYKIDRMVLTMGNVPSGQGPEESPFLSEITPLTNIYFLADTLIISPSETIKLPVSFIPEDASITGLTYYVENDLIAFVTDSGYVTGVSEGITKAHAVSLQGGFEDSVLISVVIPPPKPFQLLEPASQSEVFHGEVTFSWEQSLYVKDYALFIDNDPEFQSPEVAIFNIEQNQITLDLSSLHDTLYFWKVVAYNDKGYTECQGDEQFMLNLTAIEAYSNNENIRIFPNPLISGSLFVETYAGNALQSIDILSIDGKQLHCLSGLNGKYKIELPLLNEGLYLLRIHLKQTVCSELLLVE